MNQTDAPTFQVAGMRLSLSPEVDGVVHVRCEGDLTLPDFRPGYDPLVEFLGPSVRHRRLLLNLDPTTFLDTSGVSWLVQAHESFEDGGGRLVLHSAPGRVSHVLKLLHLDRVLHLANDLASARLLAAGGKP